MCILIYLIIEKTFRISTYTYYLLENLFRTLDNKLTKAKYDKIVTVFNLNGLTCFSVYLVVDMMLITLISDLDC